jgi:phosphate transport system permease protein
VFPEGGHLTDPELPTPAVAPPGGAAAQLVTGQRAAFGDFAFRRLTLLAALAAGGLLLLLFSVLVAQSWPVWSEYGVTRFLTTDTWAPNFIDETGSLVPRIGAIPFVAGTVLSGLIALVVAAPVGVLVAIYLVEYAPRRVSLVLTFVVELIAAIPSVVVGLWGLYIFAPFLRDTLQWYVASTIGKIVPFFAEDPDRPSTFSVFTAGMVLAIMITPMVIAISREVIRSVPMSLREGHVGLGATRWETIRRVVLPTAWVGILGGVMLAFGRALGETIAVTMVIGNVDQLPATVFEPGQTIASKIATNLGDVTARLELGALIGLGVVLLLVTVALSALVRVTARRFATVHAY